jgi:hypothetical protein
MELHGLLIHTNTDAIYEKYVEVWFIQPVIMLSVLEKEKYRRTLVTLSGGRVKGLLGIHKNYSHCLSTYRLKRK